jgi:uncharacterized protein (TIGR02145 family)
MNKLIIIMLLTFIFFACGKKEEIHTISFEGANFVTHNSFIVDFVSSAYDHSFGIGIMISKSGLPSSENNLLTPEMYAWNQFKNHLQISDLEPGTMYDIMLYIEDTRNNRTFYSTVESVTTSGVEYFTDSRDQRVYPVVKIGEQDWFAADLEYAPDGDSWEGPNGRLYTLEAALAAVPEGWRLPTDEDWVKMEKHPGMEDSLLYKGMNRGQEAHKLMQIGNYWSLSFYNNTNETGFSSIPTGQYSRSLPTGNEQYTEGIVHEGWTAYYLSSSLFDDDNVWTRSFVDGDDGIYRVSSPIDFGYAVRCVRD